MPCFTMFDTLFDTHFTATLVWSSLELFEVPAHELEYVNELIMAFVDLILLASLGGGYGLTNG